MHIKISGAFVFWHFYDALLIIFIIIISPSDSYSVSWLPMPWYTYATHESTASLMSLKKASASAIGYKMANVLLGVVVSNNIGGKGLIATCGY